MFKTDLSDVYRDYIGCLNKQDWPKLEQFVHDEVCYNGQRIGISGYREMLERDFGSSLKGVGKSEFGGGLAIAQGGSRLA